MTIVSELVDTGVRVETYTSFDDAAALAPEWDELLARIGGSLYVSHAWCRAWWEHYGARRDLRLMAIRDGDALVSVLPFFVDRIGIGPGRVRVRVARLIGSASALSAVDPPAEDGAATAALRAAMTRLFEEDRCDLVHFGPCSSDAPLTAIRAAVAQLAGGARIVRDRESGAHTAFDMPDGFDVYLKTLSAKERSNYRRNLKKIEAAHEVSADVVRAGPELEREFEAFVDMHQAQWNEVGKLGHFGDWPGSRAFTRDLVRGLARTDQVRLVRVLADGQVIAYCFCLRLGDTYHWRLPARLTGEWSRFGLGRLGFMKMMEVAAAEGATVIEAGTGSYEYKDLLKARTLPVRSVSVCRRGALPSARARVTMALGDLLHLAYYRGWYLRVAPHAGILRRPLWRSWIRLRF